MAFYKGIFDKFILRLNDLKVSDKETLFKIKDKIIQKIPKIRTFFVTRRKFLIKAFIPVTIVITGCYACSTSQEKIERNLKDIFELAKEIRVYYVDKPDYWGLSTKNLIEGNVLTKSYIHGSKIILGGGLNVLIGSGEKAETVMPRVLTFDIIAPGLNKAQCISYVESELSEEDLVVLEQITIVNSSGTYAFGWGEKNPIPVKKYASKKFCTDTGNTLIWSMK